MPNPILHQLNVLGSTFASTINVWRGTTLAIEAEKPAKLLRLYEFESCPYCRAVRETLTALHLDVEIYPCPKNGNRFRPEAQKLGGKLLFPLLIDANTNTVMYESEEIISFLFRTYAKQEVPAYYQNFFLKNRLSALASAIRGMAGTFARASKRPETLLHLWSFESSPYSRLVREKLCELEIPYVLHNIGKERWQDVGPASLRLKPGKYEPIAGGKRDEHFARTGHMQVPYLEDPNTGKSLLESDRILDYLEHTYAS